MDSQPLTEPMKTEQQATVKMSKRQTFIPIHPCKFPPHFVIRNINIMKHVFEGTTNSVRTLRACTPVHDGSQLLHHSSWLQIACPVRQSNWYMYMTCFKVLPQLVKHTQTMGSESHIIV